MTDPNNTVPGSSMVEPRTVNAYDAGSNPALSAKILEVFQEQRKWLDEREAQLKKLLGMNGKITDTVVLGK